MAALPGSLSAAEFAAKWRDNARRERASSQEHFIDLCRMLGVQTPNEADPSGEWYTFEAGAEGARPCTCRLFSSAYVKWIDRSAAGPVARSE